MGDYFPSDYNSTLINGQGRYPGGPATPLAVVNVEQGKRSVICLFGVWVYLDCPCRISYRFRLISISCDPSFLFSIDNHTMTVIEVDGTNSQPLLIDSLEIFAGARGLIQVSWYTNLC